MNQMQLGPAHSLSSNKCAHLFSSPPDRDGLMIEGQATLPCMIRSERSEPTSAHQPDIARSDCPPERLIDERTLLDYYLDAQEDERLRFGRELHDSTGQLLLVLLLKVSRFQRLHSSPSADTDLVEINDLVHQIDHEIRTLSFIHFPAELRNDGLTASVEALTRSFAKRSGMAISYACRDMRSALNQRASVALLRIVQEALTNVHRHAQASRVQVTLAEHDTNVELCVRDNGLGIGSLNEDIICGVGITGMRHRAKRLGGCLKIKKLKHGTKLIARLPLSDLTVAQDSRAAF